jgi:hypothetical protein
MMETILNRSKCHPCAGGILLLNSSKGVIQSV